MLRCARNQNNLGRISIFERICVLLLQKWYFKHFLSLTQIEIEQGYGEHKIPLRPHTYFKLRWLHLILDWKRRVDDFLGYSFQPHLNEQNEEDDQNQGWQDASRDTWVLPLPVVSHDLIVGKQINSSDGFA